MGFWRPERGTELISKNNDWLRCPLAVSPYIFIPDKKDSNALSYQSTVALTPLTQAHLQGSLIYQAGAWLNLSEPMKNKLSY
jgi:hypothetical protein